MKAKYILFILGLCGLLFNISCSDDDKDYTLTVNPESMEVPAYGGEQTIQVKSNTNWLVSSDQSWLTVTKEDRETIKVVVAPNVTAVNRSGNITCSTDDGLITKLIEVSQPVAVGEQKDKAILVALYNSASGEEWAHKWVLSDPVSQWYGVVVNNEGRVIRLMLTDNNLIGSIPEELGNMDKLEYCDLSKNQLTGTIPNSLNFARELIYLDLSENDLSGAVPALSNLVKLVMLDLSKNQLTSGHLSASLQKMTVLEYLGLHDNKFDGNLPDLGKLVKLHTLDLSLNEFAGVIPDSWAGLFNVKLLYLYNNKLEGDIPAFIVGYSLKELSLENNNLEGSIPGDLGYIQSLEKLWLSMNKLSGSIPVSLLENKHWNEWKDNVCPQQGGGFDNCSGNTAPDTFVKSAGLKSAKAKYQFMK